MAEKDGGSRPLERLDERVGRAYGCALAAVFLILGLASLGVAWQIWRSPGGGARWAGMILTLLAGIALLTLARRAMAGKRASEWLDDL